VRIFESQNLWKFPRWLQSAAPIAFQRAGL
jgi:hypothetical protein